jgi:hypothetical protein
MRFLIISDCEVASVGLFGVLDTQDAGNLSTPEALLAEMACARSHFLLDLSTIRLL